MSSLPSDEDDGIRRHHDLRIPVNDETVAATRYEPTAIDGPLPVILMVIPYRKDDKIVYGRYDPDLQYIARSGYEVVVADLLGTGASSGRKPHSMAGDEGRQVAEMIEWLAARDWATGKVGMYGKSYGGFTQLLAAVERPPSLAAIAPTMIASSLYETSYPGGAVSGLRRTMWSTQMLASRALPPSYRDDDGQWADVWKARLDELDEDRPWLFRYLDHDTKDEFWDVIDLPVERIEVPTLATVGYRDTHTSSVVSYFDRIGAPKRLLLGPWRHIVPHRGRESAIDFRRQAVEWYDRFLKGESNGALDRPRVTFWTERDGGWRIDGGHWRGADAWPTTESADRTLTFALSADGLVRDEDVTAIEREYEYDHTVGSSSMDRVGFMANQAPDTTIDDARSVTFETPPLERAVELTGTGEVTLRLEATTPDPLVSIRINDVAPDGSATPITNAFRRVSHRFGHTDLKPVTPGEEFELRLPLKSKSHVFERDHRIRVAVSAAYFPRAFPSPEHGQLTVRSAPGAESTITFPGVEHADDVSFDDEVAMAPPDDDDVPVASRFVVDQDTALRTKRDHEDGSVTFETTESYEIDLPHGPRMTWDHEVEAGVHPREPTRAYSRNRVALSLDYGHECVTSVASSRLTTDVALLDVSVAVDDHQVFDRQWRR